MRIMLTENKTLDTETKEIFDCPEKFFDEYFIEEYCNKNLVFNKRVTGTELFCDFCRFDAPDKGVKAFPYDILINSLNEKQIPFAEVVETDQTAHVAHIKTSPAVNKNISPSVIFLGEVMSNKVAEVSVGNVTFSSYNESSENISKFKAENLVLDISGIMSRNEPPEAQKCRALVLNAKKIIKDNLPFYYGILALLNEVYLPKENSENIDTMAVTTDTLLINTDFTLGLSLRQVVFVLAHEVAHIVFRHNSRIKLRDHYIWNMACDLVVNKTICEDFNISPGNPNSIAEFSLGIYSDKIKPEDTAEEVYWELMASYRQMQEMMNNMGGMGGMDGNEPPEAIPHKLRSMLSKIKQLSEKPQNAQVKPKIDELLKKLNIEGRLNALGV